MNRYFPGEGKYEVSESSSSESGSDNEEDDRVIKPAPIKFKKHIRKRESSNLKSNVTNSNNEETKNVIPIDSDTEVIYEKASEEGSESPSETSESSDSDNDAMIKPNKAVTFKKVRRKQAQPNVDDVKIRAKRSASTIERNMKVVEKADQEKWIREGWGKEENDLVAQLDDSDSFNPNKEYKLWKERELNRLKKERNKMIELEEKGAI